VKTIVVLALHGLPPSDFPRNQFAEYMGLRAEFLNSDIPVDVKSEQRYTALEKQIRYWPRTRLNDPFYTASQDIAEQLSVDTRCPVILGFAEFCAPDLDEAFDEAVSEGAEQIVVVTPEMSQEGAYPDLDINQAVNRVKERHPKVRVICA
jgi:sirohydrochlorin cobaltochelatase